MKKHRKAKKFLEELIKLPIVSVACERIGLSRNTIYQWRNSDQEFKKLMDKALELGVESVNDLAESKQLQHIQQGEPWAIKYWLDNHKATYIRPRIKRLWEDVATSRAGGFEVHIIKDREQLERHRRLQAYEEKYGPLDTSKPLTNEIVFKNFSEKEKKPLPPKNQ